MVYYHNPEPDMQGLMPSPSLISVDLMQNSGMYVASPEPTTKKDAYPCPLDSLFSLLARPGHAVAFLAGKSPHFTLVSTEFPTRQHCGLVRKTSVLLSILA